MLISTGRTFNCHFFNLYNMIFQIQYIHPADLASTNPTAVQPPPRDMYLNEHAILFINKESVQVQSISRFSQEPQLIEILPPQNHFSVFLNSHNLPCIFVHEKIIEDIMAESEGDIFNLNIGTK